MGIVLITFAYLCYAIFLSRISWRIYLILKTPEQIKREPLTSPGSMPLTALTTARDIIFLTRLFRVNPLLWFGEWLFHAAFFLVLVRHLRYILFNVPDWLLNLGLAGLLAGYILPVSLVYILIIKLVTEKKKYFSTDNFFLLLLLLLLSVTGIVMKNYVHPDIIDIKNFVLNLFAFKFGPAPGSALFIIHFATALIFLAYLPTHIFAAPLTSLEARRQEAGLDKILHER